MILGEFRIGNGNLEHWNIGTFEHSTYNQHQTELRMTIVNNQTELRVTIVNKHQLHQWTE